YLSRSYRPPVLLGESLRRQAGRQRAGRRWRSFVGPGMGGAEQHRLARLDGRNAYPVFAAALSVDCAGTNVGYANLASGEPAERAVAVGVLEARGRGRAAAVRPPARTRNSSGAGPRRAAAVRGGPLSQRAGRSGRSLLRSARDGWSRRRGRDAARDVEPHL